MKTLDLNPIPPWVKRQRQREEEQFKAELKKDSTLRILYRDTCGTAFIGFRVHLLGYSYYRSLIDFSSGLLKPVVQQMQASNIPQHLWAQMQDMGVDDVGVHVAMHNILYGLKVDRSNWKVTPETLRLLERTYDRGSALGELALNKRLAYEAYRDGNYEEVAKYATWEQKLRIVESEPQPQPQPFH